MKNIRFISILFTMLLFAFSVLFSQTTSQVKEAQSVKKKVDSGQMSPAEALQQAHEAGATSSQLQMATEQIQTQDAGTEHGTASEGETEQEQQEIFDEVLKEDVSIPKEVKSATVHFGYNFFKGSPSSFQPVKIGPVDPNYQIGPGDEIVVHLWGDTELRYTLTVSREGTIYIDNVGQVIVNGLTLEKLEKKLLKTLAKVYESLNPGAGNPSTYLDVTMGKLKPITVFFLGEVSQLGAFQVDSYSTAFTALYYLGGPTLEGSLRDIQVLRNGEVISHFDLYDYLLTGQQVNDIRLQNEDHIFIPPRGKTVTLKGEVLHPAIFELSEDETLRDLIEFAGGLLTGADLNRLQVERIIPFEERTVDVNIRTVLDYEFAKVNKGKISVKNIELSDLDLVTVYPVLNPQMDYVTITGAVFRPGKYALEDNMSINQLIQKTQGYLPDAYLHKADLTRKHMDGHSEYFDINLTSMQADTLQLQDWDHLHIYSIWDLIDKGQVQISGYIPKPGAYPLDDSLRILDLIYMAGGMEDSYLSKADTSISLLRYNMEAMVDEYINLDLSKILSEDDNENILLADLDIIRIFRSPKYDVRESVTIVGEVNYPGTYYLSDDYTLKNLFSDVKGFKEDAFVPGIILKRNNDIISINYDKILTDKKYDFPLRDADKINVPMKQGIVTITGFVNKPGKIKFEKSWNVDDYIEAGSGINNEGDKNQIYIQYPGGTMKKRSTFNKDVPEGSTIIVYEKEVKEEFDMTTFLKETASILASLTTIIFIVASQG